MKYWVGVTDNSWYEFLAREGGVDEVNFWHPSGRKPFAHLPEGTPFLFKLKRPHNHIAGGGYFIKYESLPLPLAWDAFGSKNGAATYGELARLIGPLRTGGNDTTPEVGCSILGAPFFFPKEQWIPVADLLSGNVVVGKTFDTAEAAGGFLWDQVATRRAALPAGASHVAEPEVPAVYGAPTLVRPRRGQGAFKALVTNAYQRRCAITGERTLPVLEAAHIRPFGKEGFNNTYNGLLLRSDFHRLFDVGLVTVTPDLRVEVSRRIREEWYNGKAYYRLHGQPLAVVPGAESDRPRVDLLGWHNENVYEKGGGHAF